MTKSRNRRTEDEHVPEIPVVPGLPSSIICDLDGTLALLNGRSPFHFWKCGNDLVNEKVRGLLDRYRSTHVILFMTGRDNKYREQTEAWLHKHNIEYTALFMRGQDQTEADRRADIVTKKELFERHIRNRYNVEFVVEDRAKVCRMWRSIGLYCLQVANGEY